jgi:hypothetical protein
MIDNQREKNPLLKAILSDREASSKFVELALSKLCTPDRIQPGEECRFKKWEDVVDSQEDLESMLMTDEALDLLGKSLNDECSALAGDKADIYGDGRNGTPSNSTELDFLCKADIPKPSFETFKNGLLPSLSKENGTGDLIFYSMEYAKSEYCNFAPDKGYSISPKTSRNQLESYFQPATREISELEKMGNDDPTLDSAYKRADKLTCEIISKNCKEVNKSDCFKNAKLTEIMSGVNPDDYFDSDDPNTYGNNVFLENLKEKVGEIAAGNERTVAPDGGANGDGGTDIAGSLLGTPSVSGASNSDELFAVETGSNSTDSTVTSYFSHGTSEDRSAVIEHRRRIDSGEIPANTPLNLPRRGFTPIDNNEGSVITGNETNSSNGAVITATEQESEKDPEIKKPTVNMADSFDLKRKDTPSIVVNDEGKLEPEKPSDDIDNEIFNPNKGDDSLVYNNESPLGGRGDSRSPAVFNNDEIMEKIKQAQNDLRVAQSASREISNDIFDRRWNEKYAQTVENYNKSPKFAQSSNSTGVGAGANSLSASGGISGVEHSSVSEDYKELFSTGEKPKDSDISGFDPKSGLNPRTGKRLNGEGSYIGGNPKEALSMKGVQEIMDYANNGSDVDGFIKLYQSKMKKTDPSRPESWHNPLDYQFGLILPHSMLMEGGFTKVVDALGLEGKSFYTLNVTKGSKGIIRVIKRRFDLKEDMISVKIDPKDQKSIKKYEFSREKFLKGVTMLRSKPGGSPLLHQIRNSYAEVERVDLSGDYRKVAKLKEIERMTTKSTISSTMEFSSDISIDATLYWLKKHGNNGLISQNP